MRLRTRLLTSAAVAGSLVVPLVPSAPVGAAPAPRATPAEVDAIAWLLTQQQPDGGFEHVFPGFETPDAILALAAAGQDSTTWDVADALAAVEDVRTEGDTPKTPLDGLDDWVDAVQADPEGDIGAKAQQAAKVIVLVTHPLGLDETDFDPSGDTAEPVDLLAILEAGATVGTEEGLTSTGLAYAVWARAALGEAIPPALFTQIAAGQQANGGFNYEGNPARTGFDPDITATVVTALAVAGRTPATDVTMRRAIGALGLYQRWNGEWAGEFDDGNPNSTAVTLLAAAVLCGPQVDTPAWRDGAEARLAGVPYPSPLGALHARQDPGTGRFSSPSDAFGENTFATSQAVQAIAASEDRFPYEAEQVCTAPSAGANRRIVHAMYADLLVRLADQGGADYWTAQFDGGMRPALLAKRFTGTPEYGGRVVERLYQQYLGRSATPAERQAGADLVTSGRRLQLIAEILASDDFSSGSDEIWAEDLFEAVTGRPAGEGDTDFILAQIEAEWSRLRIARTILNTEEGRGVLVREIYRQLLRRNPSAADRTYWGGELRRGVSPERLVTLIAGSAEYRNGTAP